MAEIGYLTSALVTGGLLLAVWVLVARMENWRSYDTTNTEMKSHAGDRGDSPGAWIAGFLLLVLVAGGGAVLLVSDASFAAAVGSWVAMVTIFAVLLLGFLGWGTYSSARHRGLPSSQAALLSLWLFGTLAVTAIAVKLLFAGG